MPRHLKGTWTLPQKMQRVDRVLYVLKMRGAELVGPKNSPLIQTIGDGGWSEHPPYIHGKGPGLLRFNVEDAGAASGAVVWDDGAWHDVEAEATGSSAIVYVDGNIAAQKAGSFLSYALTKLDWTLGWDGGDEENTTEWRDLEVKDAVLQITGKLADGRAETLAEELPDFLLGNGNPPEPGDVAGELAKINRTLQDIAAAIREPRGPV